MDTHFGFLSQRRESGRAKSGLNIQGSDQSQHEVLATASGASASHYVIDNWLQTSTPHQPWSEPWTGDIHTSKSPHALYQYSLEIHSRVQIPAAHAHEHSPAEHSSVQIPEANAHEHSPVDNSHCQIPTAEASTHHLG